MLKNLEEKNVSLLARKGKGEKVTKMGVASRKKMIFCLFSAPAPKNDPDLVGPFLALAVPVGPAGQSSQHKRGVLLAL